MAYLGGKPFSGLSQRQIDSLRQIFKQAPADCSDGLWRLVYDSVGPAESYSAPALLSARTTCEGCDHEVEIRMQMARGRSGPDHADHD
jgi:hypothetical protein